MRIYLDNCCYNRPYDDQSQLLINMESVAKLEIQQQIRDGSIKLVTSYILVAENSANRISAKKDDIQDFIETFTNIYISKDSDSKVKQIAADIMKTGIKLMDACHIACAILSKCDYFITTDKRVLKYKTDNIKIVSPITYIMEMEEEK